MALGTIVEEHFHQPPPPPPPLSPPPSCKTTTASEPPPLILPQIRIILCIAVLMVVCVVDDELAPRMKPNAAGEPSKFSYTYGPPFFSSALSFIPVQICACLHAFLYFRRYPSVVEKLKFVPGEESPARQRTRYPASGKFSEGIPSFIPADSEFFSRIKKEFEEI
uniref:CX domain-containing protein n=1 Tax=Caenorhabditis tropicalis TaxID=1561998 RepID=A0A1I7TR65_9PELO